MPANLGIRTTKLPSTGTYGGTGRTTEAEWSWGGIKTATRTEGCAGRVHSRVVVLHRWVTPCFARHLFAPLHYTTAVLIV